MSDEEMSATESEKDFSASDDEWMPQKGKKSSSESDEGSDVEPSSENTPSPLKTARKRKGPPVLASSLRKKLYNKYKKPHAQTTIDKEEIRSKRLSQILEESKYKKKKSITNISATTNSSDSESSGDDYMVDPNNLDLNSDFFKPTEITTENPPNFDCNVGVRLSDSESESEKEEAQLSVIQTNTATSNLIQTINSASSSHVDFHKMDEVAKQLERDKEHLLNYKAKAVDDTLNISSLLAIGEPDIKQVPKKTAETKKRKRRKESESDWEHVEDNDQESPSKRPTQDVEIRLDLPTEVRKRNMKEIDIEACLKRKLNHVKKVNQVALHKVNVLCWIAHGNYVNNVCNNPQLMASMLKMIPSTNCYPADKTSLNYFEQIVKWYTLVMCLAKDNDNEMYSKLQNRPALPMSLSLQMAQKKAICKRDYVLMFIVLLRALGIQCRVVMSLNTLPLRPAQHELCKISAKKDDAKEKSSSSRKKTPSTITVQSPKQGTSLAKKSSASSKSTEKETNKSSKKSSSDSSTKTEPRMTRSKPVEKEIPKKSSSKEGSKSSNTSTTLKSESRVLRARSKSTEKKVQTKTNDSKSSKTALAKPSTPSAAPKSKTTVGSQKSGEKSNNSEKPPPVLLKAVSRTTRSKSTETDTKKSPRVTRSRSKTPKEGDDTKSDDSKTKMGGKMRLLNVPQLDGGDDLKKPNLANLKRKAKSDMENKKDVASGKVVATTSTVRKPFADSTKLKNKNHIIDATKCELSPLRTRHQRNNDAKSKAEVNQPLNGSPKKRKLSNLDDLKHPKEQPSVVSPKKQKTPDLSKLRSKKQSPVASTSKASISSTSSKKLERSKKKKIESDSDDDYFEPETTNIPRAPSGRTSTGKVKKLKKLDRRVLSTDLEDEEEGNGKKKKRGMDMWVEVYSEIDKKWFTVDLFKDKEGKVNCVDHIYRQASHPIIYVFAWHNDKTLKDISARYCTNFNTTVRRMRADREWLDTALAPFIGKKTERDKNEDRELDKLQYDKPMPTAISEFKDHPLYALQRHLLKFQAIYPPNPPPLGYVRNEPIYARVCVYTLHSRELWLKQARTVKLNEKPYKVVTARPKWDRHTNKVTKDIPLEIFGFWQTQQYEPPTAENGIVPRNAYGNVELFKACMLPKKTVHLQLPGLNKTCRKLNIDCATAVVGFEFHGGWSHPVYDGFVICEEFQEQVVDAWNRDQEEQERKDLEKYETRVYGNWKKLIKGLFIRRRLQLKYNFGADEEEKLVVAKVPMVPADMASMAGSKKRSKK